MLGIWAIARNLIKEVLRMRFLLLFVVLMTASYTMFFAYWLQSHAGRVDQKVQTFLSYSLSSTAVFLAFLTIFIAIASITRDIKYKEIFSITTKPVSRGQFLIGKILGIALLNLFMLLISCSMIYGLARWMQTSSSATEDERERLKELVLIARLSVKPQVKDFSEEVKRKVEAVVERKLREESVFYKNNPALVAEMRQSLTEEFTNELTMQAGSVSPGQHIAWHFTGIKPIDREKGMVYIRYKQDVSQNPADSTTFGEWTYGPRDPLNYGGTQLLTRDTIRTVHEFAVPVSVISPEGELYVVYRNPTQNQYITIIFPQDTGIEVLYEAGSFEGNLLRGAMLMYLTLLFLVILSVAMGGWLSFPVAALFVMVIYVLGVSGEFIAESMKYEGTAFLMSFTAILQSILPNFARYDPVPQMETGQLVPFQKLSECGLFLIVFKGGIVGLFGYLVFKFRELARVIV